MFRLLYVVMGDRHDVDQAYRSSETARVVAATMQALATPSRVRILSRLATGPCSVGELAGDVAMEPPAVSQRLRVLRHLDLVVGYPRAAPGRVTRRADHAPRP